MEQTKKGPNKYLNKQNGYSEYVYISFTEAGSDLSLAMLLAFSPFSFFSSQFTCVDFCMHLFLHLSVSALLIFRITFFLHFYMSTTLYIASVMHFCISAFRHCSSASILDLFSHVKMPVFLHVRIIFAMILSESVGGVWAGITKRKKKRLSASGVPRCFFCNTIL